MSALDGQIALVTGSTRGIGAAAITRDGGKAMAATGDVTVPKNPRAARFIPMPRRPDGRLDPDALDALDALDATRLLHRALAPQVTRLFVSG